jgi:hypothetical protein
MKKPNRKIVSFKKKTDWSMQDLRQSEQTFIQIDIAPLVSGSTECLHIFYPQLQKSFTVSLDVLTERDGERLEERKRTYPKTVEEESLLPDEQTRCYLIREEPVGSSYTGVMRYVVREAHKHEVGQSLHLVIHAQVDSLLDEDSNIEMVGASYPELGVEFIVMLSESDGTESQAIMDELINVMLVQGWNDGEEGAQAPYGYRLYDSGEEQE